MASRAPFALAARPVPGVERWFARLTASLAARPALAIALSLLLVVLIGVGDYRTDARLTIVYIVPVAVATWTRGRGWGATVSALSVATWGVAFWAQTRAFDPFFAWDCLALGAALLLFVELLARLHIALARSDDRFVRVLRALHAGVLVSDDDGVLFANDWLVRTLGRPPSLADLAARLPIALSGSSSLPDTPAHLPFTGTEVRDAVDGRWYLAQAGAITWTDGRRVRLTVLTDISEQKRAAALARENQAALHHTARLVNLAEAGATLAHELNQPLLAIASYNAACLRLLGSGVADPGEIEDALEKCRAQAVRAGEILHRMRDLTRKRAPRLAACDLNAMVHEVLGWVRDDLDRDGIRVALSLAPDLPPLHADAILIGQVVLNLVNNAADAMHATPPSQREVRIETAPQARGAVRVTVGDRGEGIAPGHELQLFTPFFTTKPRGLGLGLSICRSVVEMHGGRLWHDRRPEGGTSFHFSLPAGS